MLCKLLQDHAQGKREMSGTQVRAAEILLRKVMPDLSTQQIEGHVEHSFADILKQINEIRRTELAAGLGEGMVTIDQQPALIRD